MSDITKAAADALFEARERRNPIAPLRDTFKITTASDAYAIQELNTRRYLDAGRRLSGRKIGLTAKAVQQQMGVSEPDYGVLCHDCGFEEGMPVSLARFIQARIEAEIAFVMERDVGAACLDHPLHAVRRLAQKMKDVGRPLRAGDIVLSGALGPMVSVTGPDFFTVEIQGFSPLNLFFSE